MQNNGGQGIVGMPDNDWELDISDLCLDPEPFAKGAFGRVFKADYLGTPVCVKIISKQHSDEDEYFKFTQREVAALKSLSHPNLVQFIGAADTPREIWIVTEFVSGGTVRSHLKETKEEIPWVIRISIALDIASAMAFLHSRRIIHRDLKSKNLLVTENWRIKLCDFGFARSISDQKQNRHLTLCGTEEYMAPEVIFGMDYDQRAEVYSFGLLMCELITRYKIEETVPRTPKTQFGLDVDAYKAIVPQDCPPGFLAIALKCASYEPGNRPEFRDVTKWLRQLKDELGLSSTPPTSPSVQRGVSLQNLQLAVPPSHPAPQPNHQHHTQAPHNNAPPPASPRVAPALQNSVSSPAIALSTSHDSLSNSVGSPAPLTRSGKVPPPIPSRVGRPRLPNQSM